MILVIGAYSKFLHYTIYTIINIRHTRTRRSIIPTFSSALLSEAGCVVSLINEGKQGNGAD